MALSPSQIRRLKAGMADPSDGNPTMVVRRDHVVGLVEMIERRERMMMDFVTQIEHLLMNAPPEEAYDMCVKFWLTDDKWGDAS